MMDLHSEIFIDFATREIYPAVYVDRYKCTRAVFILVEEVIGIFTEKCWPSFTFHHGSSQRYTRSSRGPTVKGMPVV